MIVNQSCQLDDIYNHLGNGLLGMSMEDYLNMLIEVANINPYTGILDCIKIE